VARTTSGAGGILGGQTVVRDGAMRSEGSELSIPLPATPTDSPESDMDGEFAGDGGEDSAAELDRKQQTNELTPEEQDKLLVKREEERFEEAAAELRQAIQSTPELAKLAESLIIDRTPEGLRIQIVDQDKYSMFPLGSAAMYDYARKLLAEVAKIVGKLPNRIAVTGHTDSTPYSRSSNYTNWELSTDRALASRRALVESGFPEDRVERVIGKADKEHLFPDEPNSPRNRRISVVLLRDAPVVPAGSATGSLDQRQPTRAAAAVPPSQRADR
jgi:chemotaxis protein MotB